MASLHYWSLCSNNTTHQTKPRSLTAERLDQAVSVQSVCQLDVPLFHCFLLVDTPPLPYQATKAPGTQNDRPVDATADNHSCFPSISYYHPPFPKTN